MCECHALPPRRPHGSPYTCALRLAGNGTSRSWRLASLAYGAHCLAELKSDTFMPLARPRSSCSRGQGGGAAGRVTGPTSRTGLTDQPAAEVPSYTSCTNPGSLLAKNTEAGRQREAGNR